MLSFADEVFSVVLPLLNSLEAYRLDDVDKRRLFRIHSIAVHSQIALEIAGRSHIATTATVPPTVVSLNNAIGVSLDVDVALSHLLIDSFFGSNLEGLQIGDRHGSSLSKQLYSLR
jgi:hypothetical protein